MTLKPLIATLFALVSLPAILPASIYETSFEDFSPGEIHGQNSWSANYGTEPSLCTIVTPDSAPLPPADGSQMLHLIRPGAKTVPATGIIFQQNERPLVNFTVEFEMAYEAKTAFPLYRFQIGSAADSETGVQVGIGFFEETKASRVLNVTHGQGSQRKPVPAPGSSEAFATEPLVFYHFTIRIHGDGHLYDLSVRQGDKVIASVENQDIPQPGKNYNRLIVSIPGGSQGDQLFFDGLKIHE